MIVSRGILESSRNNTLTHPHQHHHHIHPHHHGGISTLDKSTLGGGSNSSNSNTMNTTANGSILSLPYSSRTLLTNSSNRSTTNNNHSCKIEEEENPYETLPNMDDEPSDEETSTNNNPNAIPRYFQSRKQQQEGRPPVQFPAGSSEPQTDDSVISAHGSMAIYDFIRDPPPLPPNPKILDPSNIDFHNIHYRGGSSASSSASNEHVKGFLKNKLLLSSDLGSETRL